MKIDKQQIIDMLRDQGENDKAQKAQQELPDKVDTDQHQDLLQQFGINTQELLSKVL
jgi:F0F1-type ATP synthase membrane subunit b/b'